MAFIKIDNVGFEYKTKVRVLKDIDWNIQRGEFHSLIGRSGCGKTTLLKIIAGLLVPTNGNVAIDGAQVLKPSFKTGFVFQTPNLLEWLPIIDNVLLPITIRENKTQEHVEFALETLETVGLKDHSNRYPTELSGGQQSRVAIARALITQPLLLLMDEPFAALDVMTINILQQIIVNLQSENNISIILCDHQARDLLSCVDTAIVISNCKIIAKGTPTELVNDTAAKNAYFGNSFKIN